MLKTSLENLQRLFDKLIKFLKDRMFNKKERDKYYDFSVDLYTHGIINDKEIKDIKIIMIRKIKMIMKDKNVKK